MFKRQRPKPEKHMPYFKFVKSLSQSGCPVCNQTSSALDDWYESLLYESANDRPLRHRFDAANGLCARHAHRLNGPNDGLGTAVIYRTVLERTVEALGKKSSPPLHKGDCVACEAEADAEGRYVSLVADFLDEDDMRKGLEGGQGLCMPHLAAVLALLKEARQDAPDWFYSLHERQSAKLLEIIVRYIDCQKLSTEERRQKLSFDEEMAWKSIAGLLTGSRDSRN